MKQNDPLRMSVAKTIRSHKALTIRLVCAIILAVVLGLLPPLVLEQIINKLTIKDPNVVGLAVLYFAYTALGNLAQSWQAIEITRFGEKITHDMRSILCAKLSRLPASYFVKHEAGSATSIFVNDVDTLEDLFTEGIISMFADLCSLIGVLIVVFTRSKGMGIMLLIALPLLFLFTRHVQKQMRTAQLDNRKAVARTSECIPETLHCFTTIHNLDAQPYMRKRYDKTLQDSFLAVSKVNFYDSIYSPVILFISAVLTSLAFLFASMGGKWLAFFGMNAGTAVAMVNYISKVFTPLEAIGMEIQNIQSAGAGLDHIRMFLHEPEEVNKAVSAGFTEDPVIDVQDVHFSYDKEQEILKGFSVTIHKGETVTLEGRTGAGKSTLFKLVLGLYEPDSGFIELFGTKPQDIAPEVRRDLYGYVQQQFSPIQGTLLDQVTLKDSSITEEQADNALKLVGLYDVFSSLPDGVYTDYKQAKLSQGQIQLLNIARAVAKNPKLLLLDEITANLDSTTEDAVMKALRKAAAGRTVFSISHRLYENAGDRKVFLQ